MIGPKDKIWENIDDKKFSQKKVHKSRDLNNTPKNGTKNNIPKKNDIPNKDRINNDCKAYTLKMAGINNILNTGPIFNGIRCAQTSKWFNYAICSRLQLTKIKY